MMTDELRDEELAGLFTALGDPQRLRALRFIAREGSCEPAGDGAVCACHVQDCLGLSQPATSYHLKILRQAGLVSADKRGRWVHYDVPERVLAALGEFERLMDTLPTSAEAA